VFSIGWSVGLQINRLQSVLNAAAHLVFNDGDLTTSLLTSATFTGLRSRREYSFGCAFWYSAVFMVLPLRTLLILFIWQPTMMFQQLVAKHLVSVHSL
jgi:hypothetical protein